MIDLPLRYMNLLVSGDPGSKEYEETQARYGWGSIGNVIPQANMIRGASALMGGGGSVGGIDIEGWGRRMLGAPVNPTDAYDLGRAIRDLAGERQRQKGFDSQPYLLAQALLQNRDAQYWQRLMTQDANTLAQALAQEKNLPMSQLPQAIEIIRAAQTKATQQRGAQTLFSFMGGQRVQVEAQGERAYNTAAANEKGAVYNPVTNIGSRAERQAVTSANPVLGVAQAQYATNPGAERDPLSNWKWNEKEKISQQFDGQKDAAIIKNPWDRKGPAEIEKQKWAAMAVVDGAGKPVVAASALDKVVGQGAGGTAAGSTAGGAAAYVPKSVYGASPAEAVEVRRNEVLKALAASAPKAEAFMTDTGKVDFDAYKAAVETWRKNLPILAANIGTDILAQAQQDGHWNGEQLKAWLGTVDAGMIDDYKRRNDSAAEAAQRAWFELVYTKQFDALAKADPKERSTAYAKTVGSVGAMDASALAGLVTQMYGGRWTEAQLGTLLKGMTMPSMVDVIRNNMPADKRALSDARDGFYRMVDSTLPPGKVGYQAQKDLPILAALLDGKLNDMATAEHYRLAALMLGGWAKANKVESNPAEWAAARELKGKMDEAMRSQFGPDNMALLQRYNAAGAGAERAELLKNNPVIKQMLDAQSKWKAEPLYQKYYAAEGGKVASGTVASNKVAGGTVAGNKVASGAASGVSVKQASAEFWQAYNAMDSKARGALVKGNADLKRVVDSATRGTATAADWARALKALGGSSQKSVVSSQKPVVSSQTGKAVYTPKAQPSYAPKAQAKPNLGLKTQDSGLPKLREAQAKQTQWERVVTQRAGPSGWQALRAYDDAKPGADRARVLGQYAQLPMLLGLRQQYARDNVAWAGVYMPKGSSQKSVASSQMGRSGGGGGGRSFGGKVNMRQAKIKFRGKGKGRPQGKPVGLVGVSKEYLQQ
ncbi:MAG: hypothetical protein ACKN9T_11240 [Candidatus Methylumidiphilus sp.]